MSRGKKPVNDIPANDIPAKFVDRAESGMSVYGADGVMGTANAGGIRQVSGHCGYTQYAQ
ncbi:MAG: hypothetical protein ACLVLG_04210 [Anaerovoracaceae bacterium]